MIYTSKFFPLPCPILLYPEFPEPIGIFRAIQKPTYNDMLEQQMEESRQTVTKSLEDIIKGEENWIVE